MTTIFNNSNSLSTYSKLNIDNLNTTSTTILGYVNSLSTYSKLKIDNLNSTSTSLLNKTNFTNLLVSGASTINSTLNIKGVLSSEELGIVDKSTYTNQYQLLVNPPTLTTNSTLQTIQQNIGYTQILDLQPNGGSIKLSQNTTCLSYLNVSGVTTLSNNVVIGSGPATNILQVGNTGRLKIGSGITDYTVIGTRETYDNTLILKYL